MRSVMTRRIAGRGRHVHRAAAAHWPARSPGCPALRAPLASRRMRVALVTCLELPRPDHDLPILERAFASAGCHASVVAWEDPSVDWAGFDAAVLRSTWNYVAHYRDFSAWLDRAAAATRLVNPLPAVRWNLHKRYLHDLILDALRAYDRGKSPSLELADRLNKVPGVVSTATHIAFRAYSRHDLESAFSLGLD